jgi:hypothetical protein
LICASIAGYAAGSGFAPDAVPSPPLPVAAHPADNIDNNPGDPLYLGHIESMSACTPNTMISAGSTIRLHTQYNSDGPIDDVMGIMGTWVYDNCPSIVNPGQDDMDVDALGDVCDPDTDGDALLNTSDVDDDNDGYEDFAESGTPVCVGSVNDDNMDDTIANDGCPAVGAAESVCTGAGDDDGDTFANDGCAQSGTHSEGAYKIGTNSLARCGAGTVDPSPSWPSDLVSGSIPNSTDRVNVLDITAMLAPRRRLDTSPGNANFLARYDLVPGRGLFGQWVNISDLTAILAGATGFPGMFGGARAFNGPPCTGA